MKEDIGDFLGVLLLIVGAICILVAMIEVVKTAINADDEEILIQSPNYDKESLLELMEKGECAGGTIEEGKFSVFVCKN